MHGVNEGSKRKDLDSGEEEIVYNRSPACSRWHLVGSVLQPADGVQLASQKEAEQ